MNKITTYLTIRAKLKSDLSPEDAISEFQENTNYSFTDTDNVIIIDTEFINIQTEFL